MEQLEVKSIYFGGGTPSLLDVKQIKEFIYLIYQHFRMVEQCEITLEANPDDITPEKLEAWHQAGITRLM